MRRWDRALVAVCSLVIAVATASVAGRAVAAAAFVAAITVRIPFIATFRGSVEAGSSHAVTIDGSGQGFFVAVALLATSLSTIVVSIRRAES